LDGNPVNPLVLVASEKGLLNNLSLVAFSGKHSADRSRGHLDRPVYAGRQRVDDINHLIEEELWVILDGLEDRVAKGRVVDDIFSMPVPPL